MCIFIFFLFSFHFLGFKNHIALRASLLVFLSFRFEPIFAALRMEEMATSWDAHDRDAIYERIHANDAVRAIKLVQILCIGHIFKGSNKLLDTLLLNRL